MTHDTALVEAVLTSALSLKDASLVIFRRDVLVEFKTERLQPGLAVCLHGSHRGWQVGPTDGHHCHLNLAAVDRVRFEAEPVPCQRGRINYTIWFLAEGDCGNPCRRGGLFSVTLNAPYAADGSARTEVIVPMLMVYDEYAQRPGIEAGATFIEARSAFGLEARTAQSCRVR